MNLEEKEIKQFEEFDEITPESSQNLITDKGRFSLGTLYNAVVSYATELINAAVQSATTSATVSAQNAELAKNAAELAKAQAQEISDPENRIGLLQILKQNGGQLYLNGGYATTNCKPTFGAAQSLMFTYEVSEAEIDSNYWAVIGNCFDQIVGQTGISFAKLSSSARVGFNWGGTSDTRTLKTVQIAQFADGKPHAWALVCGKNATNGFFKIYRDGVLIISETSLALFDDFTPQNGFYFGRAQSTASNVVPAKGRLSRIAFFNFDVSESNALYSLADYQAGKSVPPILNLMARDVWKLGESDVAGLAQYSWNLGEIRYAAAWEDGYLVLKAANAATLTAEQAGNGITMSLVYTLPEAIPQGAQIEVSFDDWVFNTELFAQSTVLTNSANQRYYGWFTVSTAKGNTATVSANMGHGDSPESKEFRFITKVQSDKLYLFIYNFMPKNKTEQEIATGTVFAKIKGLKVKVNGAALNLENYTIARNTTTRLIKDLSAGGYDATIMGEIRGDMDRRVSVFVDELKTQIAQSTTTTD